LGCTAGWVLTGKRENLGVALGCASGCTVMRVYDWEVGEVGVAN
jgi:hypothetical protein